MAHIYDMDYSHETSGEYEGHIEDTIFDNPFIYSPEVTSGDTTQIYGEGVDPSTTTADIHNDFEDFANSTDTSQSPTDTLQPPTTESFATPTDTSQSYEDFAGARRKDNYNYIPEDQQQQQQYDTQGITSDRSDWVDGKLTIEQQVVKEHVDAFYKFQREQGWTPNIDIHYDNVVDGKLYLDGHTASLYYKNSDNVLAMTTINNRSSELVKALGFTFNRENRIAAQEIRIKNEIKPATKRTIGVIGTLSLDNGHLTITTEKINRNLQEIIDALAEARGGIQSDDIGNLPNPMGQELSTFKNGLQEYNGKLSKLSSKLIKTEKMIEELKETLKTTENEGEREQIQIDLNALDKNRLVYSKDITTIQDTIRTQISRIKETLLKILHEDTTLGEKIRTLFREQGVTIASIVTAIGLAMSTIVLALTGGTAAAAPTITPKGGIKGWVKKILKDLGNILSKLAGKAASALPGIIGGIISFILTLASKILGWIASNLWILIVAIGSAILIMAQKALS